MTINFVGCPWWVLVFIDFFLFSWTLYFIVFGADKVYNWRLNRQKLLAELRLGEAKVNAAKLDEELAELKLKSFRQPGTNYAGVN
jgi:hypothetical protein